MPTRQKKTAARKKVDSLATRTGKGRVRIPGYVLPRNKRRFKLDVEIGRYLLETPDALSREEIIKYFGIGSRQFNQRARMLAPILKADEIERITKLLLEMGKPRRRR